MKTLSSFRRQAKMCVCLVFMIILAWNPPSYANSSSLPKEAKSTFIRQVREIETAELGIPHPAGLAFSPAANVFQVMPALPLDQPLPQSTDLTTVTPFEDSVGTISILADNPDPINMVFDGVNDRLLILQPSGSKAIVVPAGPAEGNLLSNKLSKHDIGRWGLKNPRGITVDPASGQIFVLDLSGPRLVKIVPAANGGLEDAAVTAVDLKSLSLHNPQGLAFDPVTGHLHLLSRTEQKLCELTQSGQIVTVRDLSSFGFSDPQAMVIAPSSDLTDDPQQMSLYLADSGQNVKNTRVGRIVELSFVQAAAVAASSYTSALIHTIDTSKFSKPSPDPCGLTITSSDKLLICDSEVEEMTIWNGVNLFETTLSGSQIRMASTTSFTNEPTGVVRNPANQHLFFSDDDRKKIFEMNPGTDGLPGTSDDIITSFRTSTFGSNDPEDVTFAATSGSLFVVDGVNREVYQVQPGANGRFDGVSPDGDDRVTSFDTASLGVLDPEGIDFNSTTGHLYVVGKPATALAELTTAGTLVQMIDISAADALKPAGLTSGPGSGNPAARVMYVADRRVDNNDNPNENDGKVYELSLPSDTPDTPPNVAISSPINNTTYTSGTSISFSGSALDVPDGDLSAGLSWTSSIDGPIG
ncbi:MAG TPA: hypothetical protein VN374_07645, partial [Desulfitobacteriaceae bacterium]|nr:hypothetical protein [Desulfitobacteriaceae bacterium]